MECLHSSSKQVLAASLHVDKLDISASGSLAKTQEDMVEANECHGEFQDNTRFSLVLFGCISVPFGQTKSKSLQDNAPGQRSKYGTAETQMLEKQLENSNPNLATQLHLTGELVDAGFLARWLRARGSVDLAAQSILSHAEWRTTFLPTGIPEASIARELASEKVFLQANSNGFPVVLIKASRHDMGHRALDETKRLICYVLDNSLAAADTALNPSGQIECIFDLAGIRPRNLDAKALLAVFDLLQCHYPERLHRLYFINAPFIFWGIWRMVSPFLHENTRSKIWFVSGAAGQVQLCSELDEHVLPEYLGGKAPLILIQDAVAARRSALAGSAIDGPSNLGNRSIKENNNKFNGIRQGVQHIAQGADVARRAAGSAGRAVGGFARGAASGIIRAVQSGHHHLAHRNSSNTDGRKGGSGLLERMVLTQFLLLGMLLSVLKGAWEKTKDKTLATITTTPTFYNSNSASKIEGHYNKTDDKAAEQLEVHDVSEVTTTCHNGDVHKYVIKKSGAMLQ